MQIPGTCRPVSLAASVSSHFSGTADSKTGVKETKEEASIGFCLPCAHTHTYTHIQHIFKKRFLEDI